LNRKREDLTRLIFLILKHLNAPNGFLMIIQEKLAGGKGWCE